MATTETITKQPSSFSSSAGTISDVGTGAVGLGSGNTSESNVTRISVGKSTATYFYVNFDLSAIPEGAEINSVTCKVRSKLAYSFYRATVALYSGSSAKTSATDVNTTAATVYEISGGSWTRDEVLSCRLVFDLYISSSTSSYRWAYVYGADLTIVYTYENQRFMLRLGGDGVELPAGYTRLESIESTGEQYIDMAFQPNQNTRVACSFQMTEAFGSGSVGVFGARSSAISTSYGLYHIAEDTFRADYYGDVPNVTVSDDLARQTVDKNKNVTSFLGGNSVTSPASTESTPYNLLVFSYNNAGNATTYLSSMKLYTFQAYDNGTLIRDCYPCTNASGVPGLYDIVNDVFYPSATSTPFVAGPEYNNVWHDIARVFKKVSGIWVEQTDLANVVDQTKRLVNGGEYVRPVVIINFTVGSTAFQAEEGMTWAEWCGSDYDTSTYNYAVASNGYVNLSDGAMWLTTSDGSHVKGSDTVIAGHAYKLTPTDPS